MTTIAIDKNLNISADGMACGNWISSAAAIKVVKVDEDYWCCSGEVWKCKRFLAWWSCEDDILPDMEGINILRVTPSGECYSYQGSGVCKPHPIEVDLPYALGSGGAFAMGAMMFGANSKQAVEVAAKLDPYTNNNIKTYTFGDE